MQEAFLRAMTDWRVEVPHNPGGWLLSVARNLAIDQLRREKRLREREDAIGRALDEAAVVAAASDFRAEPGLRTELDDDQLTMIFVACHPCNTLPSQVALALRTLCSLEDPAIARAHFASEDAIEKRLVLARKRLREANVSFELPAPDALASRLDAVLRVLYLLFNEGYWGTAGPEVVQEECAAEAIRLATFLARHEVTRRPRVFALLALMHFHAARFGARVDERGALITLRDQDRRRWDQAQIELALRYLSESAEGDTASTYHFEAAIAAAHATSASYESTDWVRIVSFYDSLILLEPSPGAKLSRAIAIGAFDPAAGLAELSALATDEVLSTQAAFHAAEGEVCVRLGDEARARAAYERAVACSTSEHERSFLERRLGCVA